MRKIVTGATIGLLMGATTMTAIAAPLITATLSSSPTNFEGVCPTRIKFDGQITTSEPGIVQYKFLRSDNANAPVATITFDKPGTQNVSTTWDLGGVGLPSYAGWEAIQIISAQQEQSNKAEFKIKCGNSSTPSVSGPHAGTLFRIVKPDGVAVIQQGNMDSAIASAGIINVTDKDAFLVSNGHCAFNVKYDETSDTAATGTINRLFSNDAPIAVNSNVALAPGELKTIWTQPYLSPGLNNVRVVVNADSATPSTKFIKVNVAGTCAAPTAPPAPPSPPATPPAPPATPPATPPAPPAPPSATSGPQAGPLFRIIKSDGNTVIQQGNLNSFGTPPAVINVTDKDAFMISNGHCAFNIKYDEISNTAATGTTNRLFSNDVPIAVNSYIALTPGVLKTIWTQSYLSPGANNVRVVVNADSTTPSTKLIQVNVAGTCGTPAAPPQPVSATYKLKVTASFGGSVNVDPPLASYAKGAQVKVIATPNSGAVLTGWSGACTGTANPCTVTINGDTTVAAAFGPASYKLTTSVSEGGSLSVSPAMATYPYNTQVKITPVPQSEYYAFSGFDGGFAVPPKTINGCNNPQGPCTLTIRGDTLVRANFVRLYKISATASGGGYVAVDPNKTAMSPGQKITLTATPQPSHTFTGWSGGCTGTVNPCVIIMNNDTNVTANFIVTPTTGTPAARK